MAPYLVFLALPLAILAGVIFNTGELLDQKIENQDATDAAARAAGVWVARTLNFMSAANICHTKLTSAIAVINGSADAATAIFGTFLAAAVAVSAANAATIALCIASLGTKCDCVSSNIECTADVWQGVSYWNGQRSNWQSRKSSWVPKLRQLQDAIIKAQDALKLAVQALLAADVDLYYRGNRRPGAAGLACVVYPTPGSWMDILRQAKLDYVSGPSFGVMDDPSGPDRDGTRTGSPFCGISGGYTNYSPAPGTLKTNIWAGFSQFESFFDCVGPFEAYRLAVGVMFFTKSYCIWGCPGKTPSVPMQMAWYFFFTELAHHNERSELSKRHTYLLTGTPTTKPGSLAIAGDDRSWDESKGRNQTRVWGSRKVAAFDFVVVSSGDVRDLKLFGGTRSLWGKKLQDEAFGINRFLLWPMQKTFSLSQARVYNGTNPDLFTQDWRVTMVPVDSRLLPAPVSTVVNYASFFLNH